MLWLLVMRASFKSDRAAKRHRAKLGNNCSFLFSKQFWAFNFIKRGNLKGQHSVQFLNYSRIA
jgi:hypothetical protein